MAPFLYDRESQDFTAHTYAFWKKKDNSETEDGYQNARMGGIRKTLEYTVKKKNSLKCKSP